MKKLLSLLTVMAFALPLMAAGTASDPYLNITKYATIDEAGATVDGMETIYKYTQQGTGYWLTLSNYGVMMTDETQNWFTNEVTDGDNSTQYTGPWTSTDIFQGPSAYFGEGTAYSAKFKQPTKTQCFYVTFCTQVKQYAYSRSTSSYYLLKMEIYECTVNADGSITEGTAPIETLQNTTTGAEVLTSEELDPEKVYKVVISNSYSYLYEIGFKTPGVFDGEITAPVAYDVTNLDFVANTLTCQWSPSPGAKSYTLRLYPIEPEGLIFREKFTNCTEGDTFEANDGWVDNIASADHPGWSGHNFQGVDGGVVLDNNGSLFLSGAEADLKIYHFVKDFTVKFKAKPYAGATDCRLRVANGGNENIIDLDDTERYYTIVINRAYPDYWNMLYPGFVFQNMNDEDTVENHRIVLSDFKLYFGDYSEPQNAHSPRYIRPSWDGDTIFVSNIQDTTFTFGYHGDPPHIECSLTNMIAEYAYYKYDVKSVYYDGQESEWSNSIMYSGSPWPEFLEDDDDDDPIVEPVLGDVNGDGEVNSVDITILYNYILNGDTEGLVNGDQDGDGNITTVDVTVVYNVILGV